MPQTHDPYYSEGQRYIGGSLEALITYVTKGCPGLEKGYVALDIFLLGCPCGACEHGASEHEKRHCRARDGKCPCGESARARAALQGFVDFVLDENSARRKAPPAQG